ncbi:hypothetical protein Hdeb2414_s0003g00096771 [Helianthus debilis subsp. tardiflorus]
MLLKPTFNLSLKTLIAYKPPSSFLNCCSCRTRSLKPLNPITQFIFPKPSQHFCTAAAAAADDGATLIKKHQSFITNRHPQSQMSRNAEKRRRYESPSVILIWG